VCLEYAFDLLLQLGIANDGSVQALGLQLPDGGNNG